MNMLEMKEKLNRKRDALEAEKREVDKQLRAVNFLLNNKVKHETAKELSRYRGIDSAPRDGRKIFVFDGFAEYIAMWDIDGWKGYSLERGHIRKLVGLLGWREYDK